MVINRQQHKLRELTVYKHTCDLVSVNNRNICKYLVNVGFICFSYVRYRYVKVLYLKH